MHKPMRFFLIIFFLCAFFLSTSFAQDMAPLAPLIDSDKEDKNSLMDLMKGDFMRLYQDALAKNKDEPPSRRHTRPRPELGKRHFGEEPIDISKLIGTEGDAGKTVDKLRQLGKIPYPQDASMPVDASGTTPGLWNDVTPGKRFAYAQDLFQRRKYEEAQFELERFLSERPNEKERFDALMMREKCLYHRRFYDTVQDDYYRLKSFYPEKEKEIDELKSYMEEKSGISHLKKKVFENKLDPAAQHNLLSQYTKMDWLDFAEDFFLIEIQDTSITTAKSLCGIYFTKKDYEMLASLCRAAHGLHPRETAFLYNHGVALYNMGDPASREQALQLFRQVTIKALDPRQRKNAQWYVDRLSKKKP